MLHGVINVLKPPGMTSHDVVSFVRRTYGMKKVGHAGTLDPAAAGVLPVFLGQATRFIEYTADADKSYRAELTVGYETDTGDDTGRVLCTADCTLPARERLEQVLQSFQGEMQQIPPMYSAIKIDGKKMYELARAGLEVERKPRSIVIHDIGLVRSGSNKILFDVTCSKGTYVRSLCVDIGKEITCPAVMSFLVRTRVGVFFLSAANTLEEMAADREGCLLPIDYGLSQLPLVMLDESQTRAFLVGQTIDVHADCQPGPMRVYSSENQFIGMGEQIRRMELKPLKVVSQEGQA